MRYQTEEVMQIAKAIRDDSAGNKQATMTEMDLAGNMLESLAKQRDQLQASITQSNEWAKGEHARICAAEDRQNKAERERDELMAALNDLVQFFDNDELLLAPDVREHLRPIAEKARKQFNAAKGDTLLAPPPCDIKWTTAQPGHGAADINLTGPTIAELQEAGDLPMAEARTLDDLIALAKSRGYGNQKEWATKVLEARQRKLAQQEHFTSISKGGTYERLGAIRGAGQLKGLAGIAYRDVNTGGLFIRTPECFAARMKKVEQGEGGAQ